MANTIPCPNPVCTHDFNLAELQAAAQLLCPKCGFRMQGKAAPKPAVPAAKPAPAPKPAPAASKPAPKPVAPPTAKAIPPVAPAAAPKPVVPPTAKPVPAAAPAAPPMAMPVPATAKVPVAAPVPASASPVAVGAPPMATPVAAAPIAPAATEVAPSSPGAEESIPDDAFFNPEVGGAGTLVRTAAKPIKKTNWMRVLVLAFGVGLAICIVVAAIGTIVMLFPDVKGYFSKADGEAYIGNLRNSKSESEKVYKLMLSKKDWAADNEIGKAFKAHSAWRHNTQDFWFALVVKDFGQTKPRDAQMLSDAIDKLEAYFGADHMELAKMAESVKFADLPAQKLPFAGVIRDSRWLGECYMFFNNGIGYWLFVASPDDTVLEQFAGDLAENHVFVLSDRRGWREQPLPTKTFTSINGKLDVTGPEKVWTSGNARDEDETGEILLAGKFLKGESDNRKNAMLKVFTMEKKEDLTAALKAVREYLEAHEKKSNENYKLVHAAEVVAGQTEQGELTDVGNRRGRLIDLKLQFQDEPKRYFLVAVINESDTCYAIACDCAWESRQIWRQDFLDMLRTLRVK